MQINASGIREAVKLGSGKMEKVIWQYDYLFFLFLMELVMKVSEADAGRDTHIPVSRHPRVLSLRTELLGVVK